MPAQAGAGRFQRKAGRTSDEVGEKFKGQACLV